MIEIAVKKRGIKSRLGGELSPKSYVEVRLTGDDLLAYDDDISTWFGWEPDTTAQTKPRRVGLDVVRHYTHITGDTTTQAQCLVDGDSLLRFQPAKGIDIKKISDALTSHARQRDVDFDPYDIGGLSKVEDIFIADMRVREKKKQSTQK